MFSTISKQLVVAHAVDSESFDCVPLLIAAGAAVNGTFDSDDSALTIACEKSHAPTVATPPCRSS